jgi:excisionase family DNA binding protein
MKKKKYITIKEAAEILGVNPMTLRRWDKKGKLKAVRHPFNNYRIYNRRKIENLKKKLEKM